MARRIEFDSISGRKTQLWEKPSDRKETLTRLRSSLGADVVVVGSYTLLKDGQKNRIRLDFRAQDTALGETIRSEGDADASSVEPRSRRCRGGLVHPAEGWPEESNSTRFQGARHSSGRNHQIGRRR